MDTYIVEILFDSGGYVAGTTYYVNFVDRNGKVWDNVNGELVSSLTNWSDGVVAMPELGSSGVYLIRTPNGLPAGNYDIAVRKQAGSNPANTDDVVKEYSRSLGGIFGF